MNFVLLFGLFYGALNYLPMDIQAIKCVKKANFWCTWHDLQKKFGRQDEF